MITTNLHTHTWRCGHAAGEDREYVENAVKAGFLEIGFSDHAPFKTKDGREAGYRVSHAETPGYFDSLRALREEFSDRIRIHIGFEMEYYEEDFSDMLVFVKESGAEYLIQGQHFLGNEFIHRTGTAWDTTDEAVLDRYVELVIRGLETGKFSYTAHPDIIHFVGDQSVYDRKMRELIVETKRLGFPLELNRLGFYEQRHYPNSRFWELAAEEGASAVIGMDAHEPSVYLDTETVERIEEFLKEREIPLVPPVMRRI